MFFFCTWLVQYNQSLGTVDTGSQFNIIEHLYEGFNPLCCDIFQESSKCIYILYDFIMATSDTVIASQITGQ